MNILKKDYHVFHILVKNSNIEYIYGHCRSHIEISSRTIRILSKTVDYDIVNDVQNVRKILATLVSKSNYRVRMCLNFSKILLRKVLGVSEGYIIRIPISCEYFPYVSISYIEIVKKIGIIHSIYDIFIKNIVQNDSCGDRSIIYVLHYLLMLLGYNYDSSKVSLGRIIYEKYRSRYRSMRHV